MNRYIFIIAIFLLGLGAGYWIGQNKTEIPEKKLDNQNTALRLGGYRYISPLLVCDSVFTKSAPELKSLKNKIETALSFAKNNGSIREASVYFRDIKTGGEISINGTEKFYPASLKKVPLMMQYYKMAENDFSILTKKKVIEDGVDYNKGTSIIPTNFAEFGNLYTNQELINYMIKYSDNNSFQSLFQDLGVERFNGIYQEMQLHYPDTVVAIEDYITTYQFSLFFRSLYNATYLNASNSERALELLTQTDYRNGIRAGVPEKVAVAHKFGIGAVDQDRGLQVGELHDCGIVYEENNPYLLCVMTKSESSIENVEKFIASVSQIAFAEAENSYK